MFFFQFSWQALGTVTSVPIKVPQVSSLQRLAGQRPAVLPQVGKLIWGKGPSADISTKQGCWGEGLSKRQDISYNCVIDYMSALVLSHIKRGQSFYCTFILYWFTIPCNGLISYLAFLLLLKYPQNLLLAFFYKLSLFQALEPFWNNSYSFWRPPCTLIWWWAIIPCIFYIHIVLDLQQFI